MTATQADFAALYVSTVALIAAYIGMAVASYKELRENSAFYFGTIIPLRAARSAIVNLCTIAIAGSIGSLFAYPIASSKLVDGMARAYTTNVLSVLVFFTLGFTVRIWRSRHTYSSLTKAQAVTTQVMVTVASVLMLCGFMLLASLIWQDQHGGDWIKYVGALLGVVVIASSCACILGSVRGKFKGVNGLVHATVPTFMDCLKGAPFAAVLLLLGSALLSAAFRSLESVSTSLPSFETFAPIVLGAIVVASLGALPIIVVRVINRMIDERKRKSDAMEYPTPRGSQRKKSHTFRELHDSYSPSYWGAFSVLAMSIVGITASLVRWPDWVPATAMFLCLVVLSADVQRSSESTLTVSELEDEHEDHNVYSFSIGIFALVLGLVGLFVIKLRLVLLLLSFVAWNAAMIAVQVCEKQRTKRSRA